MADGAGIPTARGLVALGDDREAALACGRSLLEDGQVRELRVYVAEPAQDRVFVSVVLAVGPAQTLAQALAPIATRGVFDAELRHVLDHGKRFAAGGPSPGVAAVFGVWRNPALSHAAFDAHWRDVHAPLAVEHHVGMWDYRQCSFRGRLRPGSAAYDGLAICQFPSHEDLRERFYGGPESERAIGEDVVKFGDATRLDRVRMTEHVLRREG